MPKTNKVLVVDDEETLASFLSKIIENDPLLDCQVKTVFTGEDALEVIKTFKPDIVVCDIKLPKMNGIEVLSKAKSIDPQIYFVMMTGFTSVDSAIASLREGAYDYINKPFDANEMKVVVRNALDQRRFKAEKEWLLKELQERNETLVRQKNLLETNLEIRIEELNKLQKLSNILSESFGIASLIKVIPKILAMTLDADGAFLSWFSEFDNTLTVRNAHQTEEAFPKGMNLDLSSPPFDIIFKEKQSPVVVFDYSPGSGRKISVLAVAQLLGADKPFGLVGVLYNEKKVDTDMKFISLVSTASSIISLSIKNSQFFETIKKKDLEIMSFVLSLTETFGISKNFQQKSANIAVDIARELSVDEKCLRQLRYATLFMLFGISIPGLSNLNQATDKLIGLISNLEFLSEPLSYILLCQENFDGTGKNKIKGSSIPETGRILRVVSDFVLYMKRYTMEKSISAIKDGAGRFYDPKIVNMFVSQISNTKLSENLNA
ncbi:response regulator [candidate division WOR-3 bacterium]|nr:response regulator [candidate division WOR-3 bacterium]